jgi:hypothetical protein
MWRFVRAELAAVAYPGRKISPDKKSPPKENFASEALAIHKIAVPKLIGNQ